MNVMYSFHNDSKSRSYFSYVSFIDIHQIKIVRNTQSPDTDFVLNVKTEKCRRKQKKSKKKNAIRKLDKS